MQYDPYLFAHTSSRHERAFLLQKHPFLLHLVNVEKAAQPPAVGALVVGAPVGVGVVGARVVGEFVGAFVGNCVGAFVGFFVLIEHVLSSLDQEQSLPMLHDFHVNRSVQSLT